MLGALEVTDSNDGTSKICRKKLVKFVCTHHNGDRTSAEGMSELLINKIITVLVKEHQCEFVLSRQFSFVLLKIFAIPRRQTLLVFKTVSVRTIGINFISCFMYSIRTGSQFENAANTIAVFSSKGIGGVKSGL